MIKRDPKNGVQVYSGVLTRTLRQLDARGMKAGLLESGRVITMLRAKGDKGQTTRRGSTSRI